MIKAYNDAEIRVGDFLFGPIPNRKGIAYASFFLVFKVTPKTFSAWFKSPVGDSYDFVHGISRGRLYTHYPKDLIPQSIQESLEYYFDNNTFVDPNGDE